MQLKNKCVLLTGADGGIGSHIATQLHQQGCKLILVGRTEHKLKDINKTLKHQHNVIAVDLTQEQDRQKLFNQVNKLGGIDGLINNAGISDFSFCENQNIPRLEQLMKINLITPISLCQMFIPQLLKKEESFILNMGSTFGSIAYPGFSAYSASKFAIRGYTQTLRRELLKSNIQIMYIAPRATKTAINSPAIIDMNKQLSNTMDKPERVAHAVIYMLQKNKKNLYLGWPEKFFVQLNKFFPSIVDKALHGKLATIEYFEKKHRQNR